MVKRIKTHALIKGKCGKIKEDILKENRVICCFTGKEAI